MRRAALRAYGKKLAAPAIRRGRIGPAAKRLLKIHFAADLPENCAEVIAFGRRSGKWAPRRRRDVGPLIALRNNYHCLSNTHWGRRLPPRPHTPRAQQFPRALGLDSVGRVPKAPATSFAGRQHRWPQGTPRRKG